MAVKDTIKKYIENWKCAPGNLKGSFFFQVVIIGIFLAGFCSVHWLESFTVVSGYEYRSQGLWRFCYDSQGITCCGYINDVMYIERMLPCFYNSNLVFEIKKNTTKTSNFIWKKNYLMISKLIQTRVLIFSAFLHATRAFLVMSLISQVLCLRGVFCGIIRCDEILTVNCEVYNGVLSGTWKRLN